MAVAHTAGDDEATCLSPQALTQAANLQSHPLSCISQEPPSTASNLPMFRKIIASGCSIKSQQRGEREPSEAELCDILDAILSKKPGAFLMRFGKCLDDSDLKYFDGKFDGDFEVEFRLAKLRQTLKQSTRSRNKTVQNRRYKYLKHLMEESSYFSEEEMRQRNPLLFEYYIGQFLSEDEKYKMKEKPTDMKLSSMILENIQVDRRTKLLEQQQQGEADQGEEVDTSSDDDSEDKATSFSPMKLSSDPETVAREKAMLSQEFLVAMQASFLNGSDTDFDYSKIDDNECYDSLDIEDKDAQDGYFDSEEPSWCEVDDSDNNGMELGVTEEDLSHSEVGGLGPGHEPSGNSLLSTSS